LLSDGESLSHGQADVDKIFNEVSFTCYKFIVESVCCEDVLKKIFQDPLILNICQESNIDVESHKYRKCLLRMLESHLKLSALFVANMHRIYLINKSYFLS
jgi:hypothetical protein